MTLNKRTLYTHDNSNIGQMYNDERTKWNDESIMQIVCMCV